MILAEKIVKLRKEQGWSQEELAMRLKVSRQSVSKWESMASMPDLDKILKMSELFGVSTDYLLKDEAPAEDGCINGESQSQEDARSVTVEEANQYLSTVRDAGGKIANGVSLCILSPVLLILLSSAAERKIFPLSEAAAESMGICCLLLLVSTAVALFVYHGLRLSRYEYLEKEPIVTEYGVAGIAETKQEEYAQSHRQLLVLGIVLCIISIFPLMIAAATENLFWEDISASFIFLFEDTSASFIFLFVAVGVNLIVRTSFIWGSFQKLLEEGDFTREKKAEERRNEPFTAFYWCLVLAVYLGASFVTRRWDYTWIIWPVAAVLFAAALALRQMLYNRH